MERGSCLPRSKSSSRNSSPASRKNEAMLPLPVQASPKFAVRALLSHCFYRRVIIWAITVTVLLCLVLFSGGVQTNRGRILDHLVDFGKGAKESVYGGSSVGHNGIDSGSGNGQKSDITNSEKGNQDSNTQQGLGDNTLHWLKYKQ